MQSRDFAATIADLAFYLVAHVQDASNRALELAVLPNPLRDRLFVDDLWCLVFAIAYPRTKDSAEETS